MQRLSTNCMAWIAWILSFVSTKLASPYQEVKISYPQNVYQKCIDSIQQHFGVDIVHQGKGYFVRVLRGNVPDPLFQFISNDFTVWDAKSTFHAEELINNVKFDKQYRTDADRGFLVNSKLNGEKVFPDAQEYSYEQMKYIFASLLKDLCKPEELLKVSHYISQTPCNTTDMYITGGNPSPGKESPTVEGVVTFPTGQKPFSFSSDYSVAPHLYRDAKTGRTCIEFSFQREDFKCANIKKTGLIDAMPMESTGHFKWTMGLEFDEKQKLNVISPITYEYSSLALKTLSSAQ